MQRVHQLLVSSVYLLFAYMPFHIFLSQWLSTFTGGLSAWKIGKDIFTAILVTALVGAVLITRKYTRTYLILLGLALAYLLLHLFLVFTTKQPSDTGLLATTYNNRLMWYLLIGYSLVLLAAKLLNFWQIAKILIIVSTIVCLVGLAQWILPKDIMSHFGYSLDRGVKPAFFIDDKPDLPRVMSTIRDPNSLGAFLILPILLLAAAWSRLPKQRLLVGGLLLLHGLVLFLTFSRSAWLGTILSVGIFLAWVHRSKIKLILKKYWAIVAAGLLILVFGIFLLRDQYVVQNVVFHSDENTQLTDSNNLHLILIQEGIDGVIDQPLGHGPGTAGLVSVHSDKVMIPENYFVQIAYEVGVAGLILLIVIMGFVIKKLWELRNQTLALALLASFAGLTLMNMLLQIWSNEAVASTWWLLAGSALGLVAAKK